MKILLSDVDGKIPNLALMKISTHYKNQGCDVVLKKLGYSGYPCAKKVTRIKNKEYDKTFASILFTCNKNVLKPLDKNIFIGGSGVNIERKLPDVIEKLEEDYNLYNENKISYGFLTRGCIRKCSFCIVPKKEGKIHQYRTVDQIVKHSDVCFLDNNILAYKKHLEILGELVDKKIKCEFNQGLDIRLINNENAKLLSQLCYRNKYLFAFDDISQRNILDKKLEILKKHIPNKWSIRMFILVGYNSTLKEDMERIVWCRNNYIEPYVMRFENCWKSEYKDYYNQIASWCNQVGFFKNMPFDIFVKKRLKDKKLVYQIVETYKKATK